LITPSQYKRAHDYARSRGSRDRLFITRIPIIPLRRQATTSIIRAGGRVLTSSWRSRRAKAAALNSFTKPDYTSFEQEEILIEE